MSASHKTGFPIIEPEPREPDLLFKMCSLVAEAIARQRDRIIREAIIARLGPDGWTPEELAPRIESLHFDHSPATLVLLDRMPLLSIWPTEQVRLENGELGVKTPHYIFSHESRPTDSRTPTTGP